MGENGERARRIFEELWKEGRAESVAGHCAPDCTIHDPFRGTLDRKGFAELIAASGNGLGLPEVELDLDELVEAGERVLLRFSGQSVAAEGEPLPLAGLALLTFRDGRLVEQWSAWDIPRFGEALGLVPHGTEAVLPFDRPSPPA